MVEKPNDFKEELSSWAKKYGRWIDWEKDKLLPNGMDMEAEFNQIGSILTEKLKQEMDGIYKIRYIFHKHLKKYHLLYL